VVEQRTRGGGRGRWHGQGGFTLSELLLVSVFVVGLVLIAVNSAHDIAADTRQSNCQTELRNLKMAVAEYHASRGTYPSTVADVLAAGTVEPGEVDSWSITGGGGAEPPTYRPDLARC
jgi:Tfp pilus assembly protein PilE